MKRAGKARGLAGFTLVELLIVIAILGIIVAIAIPAFTKYKLRGYKATLDYDSRDAYTAAQAYLTDNLGATVDNLAKLNEGGYNASRDIVFVNGSLSVGAGKIELYSKTLNAQGMDNNSVVFFNGRIVLANQPQ
jgi:type IV pilus assembly protein PilA